MLLPASETQDSACQVALRRIGILCGDVGVEEWKPVERPFRLEPRGTPRIVCGSDSSVTASSHLPLRAVFRVYRLTGQLVTGDPAAQSRTVIDETEVLVGL